jgi:hypothetical protein
VEKEEAREEDSEEAMVVEKVEERAAELEAEGGGGVEAGKAAARVEVMEEAMVVVEMEEEAKVEVQGEVMEVDSVEDTEVDSEAGVREGAMDSEEALVAEPAEDSFFSLK